MATLRLHLGEPAAARNLWHEASDGAAARHPETRGSARPTWSKATSTPPGAFYEQAINADPNQFEPHYCLAVLEQDAGNAPRGPRPGDMLALRTAKDEIGQSAARAIAKAVARFARESPQTLPAVQ